MKNTLVLFLIITSFSTSYSQDLFEKIQKLTLEKDSLQREITPLNDKIIKLTADSKKNQENLNALEKKNKDLENKNKDLDKKKVKADLDKSQKENNSLNKKINELDAKIIEKDLILKEEKLAEAEKLKQEKQKLKQEKEIGKQEVVIQILQSYNKPFDDLIKSSTLKSVERDLLIVGNNSQVNQKLLNLQKYFSAEQVLSVKYNEQKVKTALNQIDSLEKTELVKNLTDKLSKYKLCYDALKSTLNKIIELDKNFIASDDNIQKLKLKDIFYEFGLFIYDYAFNFSDYPYLSDIILEIMNIKRLNSDTDIRQFLDKL